MNSLTERIDAILRERKMSRRQLAIAANIPASSFQAAMARGRNMTVEMLQSIAAVLNMPVSSFFEQETCIDEPVADESTSHIHDFLETLRDSARNAGVSIGEFLGLLPEKRETIDHLETALSDIQERCNWMEHDPYITEDRIENMKCELLQLEEQLVQYLFTAILDSRQAVYSDSEQRMERTMHESEVNKWSFPYQKLNDEGQRKLSAYAEELFRLLIQIPAYRRSTTHSTNVDPTRQKDAGYRDIFGSNKLPFDEEEQ